MKRQAMIFLKKRKQVQEACAAARFGVEAAAVASPLSVDMVVSYAALQGEKEQLQVVLDTGGAPSSATPMAAY